MTASRAVAPASTNVPFVRGEGLRVEHRDKVALDVDHIAIPAGSTYALLGASGAGKSTLLRVVGLLEKPNSGRVLLDGREVSRRDLKTRRTIAAVFQKPYLLRATVGENAGYGLRLRRMPAPERAKRVAAALERVGLAGWENRSALTLSGGEAQRVALARALVIEPSFLLLDEPLSYLDPLLKRSLSVEFAEILASEHITALYVTHDQDEAAVVADVIGVMRDGRIVAEGDPDSILGLPEDEWLAAFFDMEPPLRGRVSESQGGVSTVSCCGAVVTVGQALPVGSQVLLAVRPEDANVRLGGDAVASGEDRSNRIEGTVSAIRPRGASVQVVVERDECRIAASLSRSASARMGLTAGDTAVVEFSPSAVRAKVDERLA